MMIIPHVAFIPYFGFVEEIWELNYVKFIVNVFKCKWVDNNIGVWTDDLGFMLVDLNKLAYQSDPFIMVEQAQKLFYVQDPCDETWLVMKGGQRFYTGKQLVLMLKMMIHSLIFMSILCPHKSRLTSSEKKKLKTFMQILMIMMKKN